MIMGNPGQIVAANELAWLRWRTAGADGRADRWLERRGLDPTEVRDAGWRLGWAETGWRDVVQLLRRHRIPMQLALEAGLIRRAQSGHLYDGFRGRVVIPVRDLFDGRIRGFTARRLDDADQDVPKYLNSPNNTAYQKGRTLLGAWEARQRLRADTGRIPALVVCEGPFDAIRINAARQWVAVAPCGTALTLHQAQWITALARAHQLPVQLAYDGDTAGHEATWRSWDLLRDSGAPGLRLADIPDGRDPASLAPAELAMALGARPNSARR